MPRGQGERRILWDAAADATLRRLWAEGHSTVRIAVLMGLGVDGKNAIIGRAHRLGLPKRSSPIRTAMRRERPRPESPPRTAGSSSSGIPRARPAAPPPPARAGGGPAAGGGFRSLPPAAAPAPVTLAAVAPAVAAPAAAVVVLPRAPAAPAAGPSIPIRGGCRWPMWGDEPRPTHVYCDAPRRSPGCAYCAPHAARAYRAVPEGAAS